MYVLETVSFEKRAKFDYLEEEPLNMEQVCTIR